MTWKLTIASRSNDLDQQLQTLIPTTAISKVARGDATLYEVQLPSDCVLPREWLQQNTMSYTVHKANLAAEHWHETHKAARRKQKPASTYEHLLTQPTRKAIVRSILSRPNASTRDEILDDTAIPSGTFFPQLKILLDADVLIKDRHPSNGHIVYYYISNRNEALQDVLSKLFPEAYEVPA